MLWSKFKPISAVTLLLVLILFPVLSAAEETFENDGKKPGAANKPWGLNISVGAQYDDNVILNPENSALPEGISNKSDWRALAYLKGNYALLRKENLDISAGYSFYQSLQRRLSDFNVTKHSPELAAVYSFKGDAAKIKGKYCYEYVYAGGDSYNYAHSIGASFDISGDRLFGDLHYEHSWSHYIDSARFTTNSERTGQDNLAGISIGGNITDSIAAMIGYDYDKNSARKDYWEYTGNKISLTVFARLPKHASINLGWWLQEKDYDSINPAYNEARRDTTQGYSMSLKKGLSDVFGITAGVFHTRNDSNISAVEYKRTIYSLILTARY